MVMENDGDGDGDGDGGARAAKRVPGAYIQWHKTSKGELGMHTRAHIHARSRSRMLRFLILESFFLVDKLAVELARPAVAGIYTTPIAAVPTAAMAPLPPLPPPLTPFVAAKENQGKVKAPTYNTSASAMPTQTQPGQGEQPAPVVKKLAHEFKLGAVVQMADGTIGEVVGGPDENGYFDVDVYSGEWEL
jgi:hypothetical protein